MTFCAVDGCEKTAKTRGWCSAHYERWRRNGDPGPAGDGRKRPVVPCSVDGCDRKATGTGWCMKHRGRWRRNGDPTLLVRKNYGTKRRVRDDGYIDIYEPDHPLARNDGYVFEHRKKAWDAGLFTDPSLEVHHKNEVRSDNSLDNIEPKDGSQHTLDHVEERGWVVNQFGKWTVKPRGQRQTAPRPIRPCVFCHKTIPLTKRRDAKFCSDRCRQAEFKKTNPGLTHQPLTLADLLITPAQRREPQEVDRRALVADHLANEAS